MPEPTSIVIEITPDGKVVSTVHGVSGPDCTKLAKFLDELGTVEKDEHTADYHKKPERMVQVKR